LGLYGCMREVKCANRKENSRANCIVIILQMQLEQLLVCAQ
jgi:hypothetical protein